MQTGKKGPQGLRFNGEKFMVLRTTPEPVTVIGKKVGARALPFPPCMTCVCLKTKGGICITRTAKCIVVGTFDENLDQTAGVCNIAVEKLGDYLRNHQF